MKTFTSSLALCAALIASGAAQAALIDRGGGLIYDTDLNVTWLQDANYAQTSSYVAGGSMASWMEATAWAANLSYYDSVRGATYTDWRLPSTLQPDASCGSQFTPGQYDYNIGTQGYGYGCTGSEMGHLFYNELGGVAGQSIATTHNAAYNLFLNIQPSGYWSETEYANTQFVEAWSFIFNAGDQASVNKRSFGNYAMAVRPGDVAAAPVSVPEPVTLALFGMGLAGLGWARRR